MSQAPHAALIEQDAPDLEQILVSRLRERFKAETNRLTSGGMRQLLGSRPDAEALSFPLSYLSVYHWLRQQVPDAYRAAVLGPFRGPQRAFLMDLLDGSADAEAFLHGYITQLRAAPGSTLQQRQLLELLAASGNDVERLTVEMMAVWRDLGLFTRAPQEAYSVIGHQERARYRQMLDQEDQERLALVDALPDPGGDPRFDKLGVIPAMGCPQTCRHCMFIWRPPMRDAPDPGSLLALVNAHTRSVLFTGGDLTRHLDQFLGAIRTMDRVQTFAILLNGDFADDPQRTEQVLGDMSAALRARPKGWPPAQVLLQISFDEFHQEVIVDRHGRLRERIPVAKIANIVECAPRHPRIQLCLLHKQNALSFSMDVFRRGVFARLARELGRRGHQIRILTSAPSPRLKRNPLDPDQQGQVLKDASFVLARHPDRPILFTSSTIDAYGRATILDPGETVKDRDLLHEVLQEKAPTGEGFDTDLMFWANGWATLFSAVHICLGDLYQDGGDRIFARQRKDPLTTALGRFDLRLLDLYAEVRPNLTALIDAATSPHHLFHSITEDADVRLHMTRRLAQSA
ncbi:MAG: hypothetical protein WAK53_02645 [Chromatiaceae bacterium]|jgi:hypothetical protein